MPSKSFFFLVKAGHEVGVILLHYDMTIPHQVEDLFLKSVSVGVGICRRRKIELKVSTSTLSTISIISSVGNVHGDFDDGERFALPISSNRTDGALTFILMFVVRSSFGHDSFLVKGKIPLDSGI